MISKEAVEHFLRANDVHPTAPDEQIKEILLRAKWNKRDVDTALTVLRENLVTNETYIDTLHKVIRTDERLQPDTISALLGVEVDVSEIEERDRQRRSVATSSILSVLAIAISLTIIIVGMTLWLLEMGPFYTG